MRFHVPENCGNAPRVGIVLDLVRVWVAGAGTTEVEDLWTTPATEIAEFGTPLVGEPAEVRVLTVVTHGRTASCDGILRVESGRRVRFSCVFEFTGAGKTAKLAAVRRYLAVDG